MNEKKIVTWEMFKKYHEHLVGYIEDKLVVPSESYCNLCAVGLRYDKTLQLSLIHGLLYQCLSCKLPDLSNHFPGTAFFEYFCYVLLYFRSDLFPSLLQISLIFRTSVKEPTLADILSQHQSFKIELSSVHEI